LGGERAKLVLDRDHFVCTLVGGLDGLDIFVGNVMLDIKDLGLLSLGSVGTSDVPAGCQ
jgi:hypothetical protein